MRGGEEEGDRGAQARGQAGDGAEGRGGPVELAHQGAHLAAAGQAVPER